MQTMQYVLTSNSEVPTFLTVLALGGLACLVLHVASKTFAALGPPIASPRLFSPGAAPTGLGAPGHRLRRIEALPDRAGKHCVPGLVIDQPGSIAQLVLTVAAKREVPVA